MSCQQQLKPWLRQLFLTRLGDIKIAEPVRGSDSGTSPFLRDPGLLYGADARQQLPSLGVRPCGPRSGPCPGRKQAELITAALPAARHASRTALPPAGQALHLPLPIPEPGQPLCLPLSAWHHLWVPPCWTCILWKPSDPGRHLPFPSLPVGHVSLL